MFRVSKAFEKAIGGAEQREGNFGPVNERREAFVVSLTRFAEEDCLDAATGAEGFLDQPDTFDADAARFCWQPATKGHAKSFEPTIVAAGENRRRALGLSQTRAFAGSRHHRGAYQISGGWR